jgi:hypothetical protein
VALTQHIVAVFPPIQETEQICSFVHPNEPLASNAEREALGDISLLNLIQEMIDSL